MDDGHELYFKVVIDDSDLNDSVNRIDKSLDLLAEKMEKAGDTVDQFSFSSIAEDSEGFKDQLQQVYSLLKKVGDSGSESESQITKALGYVIKNYSSFEGILRAIIARYSQEAAAVTKDTIQKTANTVATTAQAAATRGATSAQIGLNAAMAANPLGLILTALGTLLPLLLAFNKSTEESISLLQEFRDETEGEIAKLSSFCHILRTSTNDTTAHKEALEGVNKMAKEYNLSLLNENSTLEDQRAKYIELTNAIKATAQAKILASHTEEAYSALLAKQDEALDKLAKKFHKKDKRKGTWADTDADTFWQGIQASSNSFIESILGASPQDAQKEFNRAVNSIMSTYEESSGQAMSDKVRTKLKKEVSAYVQTLVEAQRETDETVGKVQNTLSHIFKESTNILTGPVESFGELYDKAREAYSNAVLKLAEIEKDRSSHTLEEYNQAKQLVSSTKQAFKDLGGDVDTGNKGGTRGSGSRSAKQSSADKAYEEELKVQREREALSASIAKNREQAEIRARELEIRAMKSGFSKQQAELKLEHEKRVETIRNNYLDMIDRIEKVQLNEYKAQHGGSSQGFVFNNSDSLVRQALSASTAELEAENNWYDKAQEALEKKREESHNEYLKQYGNYKEKVLAITKQYDEKIDEVEDEWQKRIYERQKADALDDLAKEYSAAYALIFSDVDDLSKTLLAKAIEATQAEIEKAKKDGNIQALTELYKRLREQLDKRDEKWGFSGLSAAFEDLANARAALMTASENGDAEEQNKALIEQSSALSRIEKTSSQIKSTFSDLGTSMSSFGGTIGEIGEVIKELANGAESVATSFQNIGKEVDGSMKASAIQAGITATINLLGMIGQSISENKKKQEEWNNTILKAEHEYAMLKLQALDYKQRNIFGVENPYKKAIDGATQYAAAMGELSKMTAKLNEGQVQTGTSKAIDWKKVAKGAAEGAGAGALIGGAAGGGVFSWATAAIGTAIGAVTGAIAGILSTKTVPVFDSLISRYEYLYDDKTYELNPAILADYEKLDDATKQIVDNWDDIKDKALEAEEQMRQTFLDLAGDIGNRLSDSLVAAFRNGDLDSAVDDFHKKMNSTIEDIIQQMIFSNVFSGMFDDLQKEMEESFKGPNADNNIVDDLMRFEKAYQEGLSEYEKQMKDARDYLESQGYSGWENEDQRKAQTKSALGASQDSVDESNARLTTIQAHTYELNENVKKLVAAATLAGAAGGDSFLPSFPTIEMPVMRDYTEELLRIREDLGALAKNDDRFMAAIAVLQGTADGIRSSSVEISNNTQESKQLSGRIRSALDMVVDSGVKMK